MELFTLNQLIEAESGIYASMNLTNIASDNGLFLIKPLWINSTEI